MRCAALHNNIHVVNKVLLLFTIRRGYRLSVRRRRPAGVGFHLQRSCWRTEGHPHSDALGPVGFQQFPGQFWLYCARQQRSRSKRVPRYCRKGSNRSLSTLLLCFISFIDLSHFPLLADLIVGAFGVDKAVLYRYV